MKRKRLRLKNYNYSKEGAYFVTICTFRKWLILGDIINGKIVFNDWGKIVDKYWREIPEHFKDVQLDAYVIMPNHIHGIIIINPCRGRACPARTLDGLLSIAIGSFKSAVTKHINEIRRTPGVEIWQRSFHDHIIRNDTDINRSRDYIINNPNQWQVDENHPQNSFAIT